MVNGNLTRGWTQKSLGELAKVIYRYPTFYGMEHLNDGVPVIRGEHINADGTISHDWTDYWYVSSEISQSFPRTVVELHDLIMSVRGSVGKLGIIDESLQGAQVSPNCIRISLDKDICSPKFLLYFLKSAYAQSLIQGNVNATTIQTIKASSLSETPIPVPPLPEQERIVAKIEELFTQLEAGTAALRRVQAGVKRYKASVLKAAVSGRLVNGNVEIGEGELLDGWRWAKVGDIAEHRLGKMLDKEKNKGELRPYLRNLNVRWFEFDLSDIQYMRVTDEELENITVRKGDLVVCEGGEPGRAAVWNKDEPFRTYAKLKD